VALLPLFLAAGLIYGGQSGSASAMVAIAPALFYSGYAIASVKRMERKLTRRQVCLQADVVRRVDEFSPNEVRLSRHYFETRLAQEIKRSRRHRLPLCVVTLSTPAEREKAVHTSQLVELSARTLRSEDCAGRLGRHLYAICLPHTTPAGAEVVIQRLRSEFEGKAARFGLTYLEPGVDSTPAQLLQAAIESRSIGT
jgi:GGDEF domain-containing protein